MAPSNPPPPSKLVLAAFTIASTASLVMSPRVRASLGSGIAGQSWQLWFVDQPDAARVLVKRPWQFHRARLAVERKRFRVRMLFPPFGKVPADAAFVRDIEFRGEAADIVKNEKSARRERAIPEIEFRQRGLIFVRAIENDQLGFASEIISRGGGRSGIERAPLHDFDIIFQSGVRDPAPRHFAHGRIEIQTEEPAWRAHPPQHPSEKQ